MSRFSLPTKSFALLACLALLSAALLGCNIGEVTAPEPANNGVVLNPNFVRVLPASARDHPGLEMASSSSGIVSAELGGSVSNGRVTLDFPPGALSEDAVVSIGKGDPEMLIVDLSPEGVYFKAPVVLKFNLLGTSAEGQAASIRTVWFNEKTGYWEYLEQLPPDGPNETRVHLEHFSAYGNING